MTQKLSTSAVFKALQDRVQSLEQISPLPSTLGNAVYLSGKRQDGVTTRLLGVNAANALYIGGIDAGLSGIVMEVNASPVLTLSATGQASFNSSVQIADQNYMLSIPASNPRITFDSADYLSFDRTNNNFIFCVAGSPVFSATSSSVGFMGDINFNMSLNGTAPKLTFDNGDFIQFDRLSNKIYFGIGGTNVGSIDASGNLRLKGTLTQSVTP